LKAAIPVRILTPDLELVAEIDSYAELYYTRSLIQPGTFALSMPLGMEAASALIAGNYLLAGYSGTRLGTILEIKKQTLAKGTQWIIARGNEATCLLGRRVIVPGAGESRFERTAAAETIIKELVETQCGFSAGSSRALKYLRLVSDRGRGASYTLACAYTNLLSELCKCATAAGIGFSVRLDIKEKVMLFDIVEGVDRSASQSRNGRALFSTGYDSVRCASIEQGHTQYSNTLYVKGARQESVQNVAIVWKDLEPEGHMRFERAIDAWSLEDLESMRSFGLARLNTYAELFNLEAELPVNAPLELDRDYFLGDICSVEAYGQWYTVPLEKIDEHWTQKGTEIRLGFGRPALGSHSATMRETEALWEALGALQ